VVVALVLAVVVVVVAAKMKAYANRAVSALFSLPCLLLVISPVVQEKLAALVVLAVL